MCPINRHSSRDSQDLVVACICQSMISFSVNSARGVPRHIGSVIGTRTIPTVSKDSDSIRHPVVQSSVVPFEGADVVSELAVKVIRQFHSGIPSGSASHPSSHCSRLCAAKHNEGNSGVAFSFFEYALIRPLDSLSQCAEGIEAAIQLVAWEPRQIHYAIVVQSHCQWHWQTQPIVHIHKGIGRILLCPVSGSPFDMPVPFCKEQSFRFRHLRPARLDYPVVRAIDLSLDAKRVHSHSQRAHWAIRVLVRVIETTGSRSSTPRSWQKNTHHWGSVLIPLSLVESLCQSNLGSQHSIGKIIRPFNHSLAVILHDSAHIVVKLTPHSGELNSTIHRSEGGRHFHSHRPMPAQSVRQHWLIHQIPGFPRSRIQSRIRPTRCGSGRCWLIRHGSTRSRCPIGSRLHSCICAFLPLHLQVPHCQLRH